VGYSKFGYVYYIQYFKESYLVLRVKYSINQMRASRIDGFIF